MPLAEARSAAEYASTVVDNSRAVDDHQSMPLVLTVSTSSTPPRLLDPEALDWSSARSKPPASASMNQDQETDGWGHTHRLVHARGLLRLPPLVLDLGAEQPPACRSGGRPGILAMRTALPFRHVGPEDQRVSDLADQLLAEEGSAILGWAVRGALEVLAHGLADPPAVLAATEEYRISEDTLASFGRDECLLGPNQWCKIAELRERYERHSEEMGAEPQRKSARDTASQ
jgi:hypothetical protein